MLQYNARQFRKKPTLKNVILKEPKFMDLLKFVAKNRLLFLHYCIVTY